jgi:hypothetical protein
MKLFTLPVWLVALSAMSQTIVSTTPENAKVILEEFTGIYCTYCPEGHAIAEAIQAQHPDDVFIINIHAGSFAAPLPGAPDFRTPWGTALVQQSELIGYPAGTVNRLFFQGLSQNGSTSRAMNRENWENATNQTLASNSYVNLGVESTLNASTGELEIHVEAYYTGSSPVSENYLNVAILQDNTLGPQTGGGQGNNYVHKHRLVDLVTGQFGEEITTTSTGTFIDRTYNYSVPPDYNGVPTQLADLEVVVFMAESSQDIISGNASTPDLVVSFQNDLSVAAITSIGEVCYGVLGPEILLQNVGSQTATSAQITYEINGASYSYTWNGTLSSLEQTFVNLPAQEFPFNGTNVVAVSIGNDDFNGNNDRELAFLEAQEYQGNLVLNIDTDGFGNEFTWEIIDYAGAVFASGGPYGPFETINQVISMNTESCYTFSIYDSAGNGGTEVFLRDAAFNTILQTDGEFGASLERTFGYKIETILGQEDNALAEQIDLWPNPTRGIIQISDLKQPTGFTLYNLLGQKLSSGILTSDRNTLNLTQTIPGVYLLQLNQDGKTCLKKIIKE